MINVTINYQDIRKCLGLGSKRSKLFPPLKELKKAVQKLGITTRTEYYKYIKEYNKNWPYNPCVTYKNKGWKDYCDFFGRFKFPLFEELKKTVQKLGIKTMLEYLKYRKKHDKNWPSNPDATYKNKGWKDWGDFLGTKSKFTLALEELKKIVQKFGIKTVTKYREYIKKYNKNWPYSPNKHYKNKGWKDWYDFFGVSKLTITITLKELKKILQKFDIKTLRKYSEYRKKYNKNWPSSPQTYYKNKGWKDWDDFFGNRDWLSIRVFTIELKEFKKIVQKLGIKGMPEYLRHRKEHNKNWPSEPHQHYKNEGWKDYYDFFGKTNPKHFSNSKVK